MFICYEVIVLYFIGLFCVISCYFALLQSCIFYRIKLIYRNYWQ